MSDPGDQPTRTVAFELEADELALNRLLNTAETFLGMLREVGNSLLPTAGVRWLVESISMASPLRLQVRPIASRPDVTVQELDRLASTVVAGMLTIQTSPQRPPFFNDLALERAKALGRESLIEGTHLRVGSEPGTLLEVSAQLIANVDKILGRTLTSIGTVEGRLEAFNVHGSNRYFNLYDALTGERIRCDFGHRISVTEIGAAAERRVAVHGEIIYRESGEIVSVRAHSLEIFPREEDLPSADDVRGIL